MIVCVRTVGVPAEQRGRYLAWIAEGRAVREAHGILGELVLEPSAADGDTIVITLWPSHACFDAWIATPAREALTDSEVHRAVDYRPSSATRSPVAISISVRSATALTRFPSRRYNHEVGHSCPSQD